MFRPIKLAARRALRSPRFSVTVAVLLALGVGAAGAATALYRNLVLHPLPFANAGQLVEIETVDARGAAESVSPPDFLDYRARQTQLLAVAGFYPNSATITGAGGGAEHVAYSNVAAGFFATMAVHPALGRALVPADEVPQLPVVAVISDGLWRGRFGADPQILGRQFDLDGRPVTAVGVMPPGFDYPEHSRLWMPEPFFSPLLQSRQARFLEVVGRLRPGATLPSAAAEAAAISRDLARTHADTDAGTSLRVTGLVERLAAPVHEAARWLLLAALLLFALTCANVGSLMLVLALTRQKEAAIRACLGATPWQVAAPLAWECLLPACIGGAGGAWLTWTALRIWHQPAGWAAAGAVLGLTLLCVLLCVAAPAAWLSWRAFRAPAKRVCARPALTVAQVAIATALLAGAGLLARSHERVRETPLGFAANHLLTFEVSIPASSNAEVWQGMGFFQRLQPALAQMPGVEAAGMISTLPLAGGNPYLRVAIPGGRQWITAEFEQTTPGYFAAMGIPLATGRDFSDADARGTGLVAVIDDTLAQRLFQGRVSLNQTIVLNFGRPVPARVIGVVGAARTTAPWRAPRPAVYIPFAQDPAADMYVAMRTGPAPESLVSAVRNQTEQINAAVPIYGVETMDQRLDDTEGGLRRRTEAAAAFAGLALLLAGAGIFSLMAATVERRRKELSIRQALGAPPGSLSQLVTWSALRLGAAGVAIGLLAAWPAQDLLKTLLFEVDARDPWTWGAAAALLLALTWLASYLPARRAARVDAWAALKQE